jgi:hypothetical protein
MRYLRIRMRRKQGRESGGSCISICEAGVLLIMYGLSINYTPIRTRTNLHIHSHSHIHIIHRHPHVPLVSMCVHKCTRNDGFPQVPFLRLSLSLKKPGQPTNFSSSSSSSSSPWVLFHGAETGKCWERAWNFLVILDSFSNHFSYFLLSLSHSHSFFHFHTFAFSSAVWCGLCGPRRISQDFREYFFLVSLRFLPPSPCPSISISISHTLT